MPETALLLARFRLAVARRPDILARLSPDLDALSRAAPYSLAAPTVPRPGGGWGRSMVWLAPHPSGRSRWWNSPANRAAAALFFGCLLGRTEFPGGPELPAPADLRGALDVLAEELAGRGPLEGV